MTDQAPDDCKLLVIGYGSELRGDDAAGPRAAAAIEQLNLPGVRAVACHQLTPELADPISRAAMVVFVDADATGASEVRIEDLAPAEPGALDPHLSDPRALLALARTVFGRCPRARLIAVPAADFDLGDRISPVAQRGIEQAIEEIKSLAAG